MFDPKSYKSTRGYGVDRLSILVYGPTKAGKTTLAKTTGALDKTVILGAEPGLLPLRNVDITYYEIDSIETLEGAFAWLEGLGRRGQLAGRWVILDSISDIAERLLRELKQRPKSDPRQAYGEVQDVCLNIMKRARQLPCNTVFIAKQERIEDGEGRLVYGPSYPGKALATKSGYEFELVLAYRLRKSGETVERWLQTEADGKYEAGDRSGVLLPAEPPDLGAIASKILASAKPAPPPPSDVRFQRIEMDPVSATGE